MKAPVHTSRRARTSVGLLLLCAVSAQSAFAENVWQSTFGQRWFYESRSWSGQQLAGTWWESSLNPGTTYEISFEVNHLSGAAGLHVGERPMIRIDREGWHSYDFKVWQGSKRRLMFTAQGRDVTAGIGKITVKPKWASSTASSSGDGSGGGGNWLPKGHYLSFARERNLKAEMLDLTNNPSKARSNWHLNIAYDLENALKTAGVKGFSMAVDWRTLETGDGRYNWSLLDANMEVARRLGLKFIVQIRTRSFDGSNIMPRYFPGQYVIWTTSGRKSGFVAKLWDPWVYNRLIRLYKKIAWRYGDNAGFGGIATSETAVGEISGGDYTYRKYREALDNIATQTQAAMKRGRLFLYLNFLRGGVSSDMRKDGRVDLVNRVPTDALVVGGPDITPDRRGMPGSMSSFRIHLRKTEPHVQQFCQAQHVDQGLGGINRKSNEHRRAFVERVNRIRTREKQSWFNGQKAVFQFDDLRHAQGPGVEFHPNWVLGDLWKPWELFSFADRNFDCDYFIWHYRENVHNLSSQFWWPDIRPVILNNQYFYK